MCPKSELEEKGSYFSSFIASFPVFAIHSKEGIQSFHNVCPHKGSPLFQNESKGVCDVIRCPYHGWMFDSKGSLKITPFIPRGEFNLLNYSLFNIPTVNALDFIFVRLAENQTEDFNLDFLVKSISPRKVSDYGFLNYKEYLVNSNWKIYIDNWAENLHFPFIHKKQLSYYKSIKTIYSLHRENEAFSFKMDPKENFEKFDAVWIFKFPNICFDVYEDYFTIEVIDPVSPTKAKLKLFNFIRKNADSAAAENSNELIVEDLKVIENVQYNYMNSVSIKGYFSQDFEKGTEYFYDFYLNNI